MPPTFSELIKEWPHDRYGGAEYADKFGAKKWLEVFEACRTQGTPMPCAPDCRKCAVERWMRETRHAWDANGRDVLGVEEE